jgi:hypothetical protein
MLHAIHSLVLVHWRILKKTRQKLESEKTRVYA